MPCGAGDATDAKSLLGLAELSAGLCVANNSPAPIGSPVRSGYGAAVVQPSHTVTKSLDCNITWSQDTLDHTLLVAHPTFRYRLLAYLVKNKTNN